MKNTCEKCKAMGVYPITCDLGYKIKVKIIDFIEVSAKPLEECPKPLTNKQYIKLYNTKGV